MDCSLAGLRKDLFIGGAWRPAQDGARLDVIDPATEQVIAQVADAGAGDALQAVDAAAAAGPAWAARPPRERGEILRRAFELIIGHREDIARLITLESGKALAEARGEATYAAEFLRWYSEEAVRAQGEIGTAPSGANRMIVLRQPIGVCVFITPWNFPAAMATRKIGPALAAGCTVVLKPAKETPLTALAMAALFEEAGVPPGVVNVVPTRRSSTIVAAMLRDPRVRKLSFTGSTQIGRVLLRPGRRGHRQVLDGTRRQRAVPGVRRCGPGCGRRQRDGREDAQRRRIVHRGQPLLRAGAGRGGVFPALRAAMAAIKVGPGLDEGVQMGPLVNAATRDKVAELVADARGRGGRVLTGGKAPARAGFFYEPTVIAGLPTDARAFREEIFGPVAPIASFDSVDEAVALANDTEFGLVSFVHTRDLAKALAVAERIESGMVGINRGIVSDPAAPFGGWKQSGVGREGAHEGLLEYLETKYIAASW